MVNITSFTAAAKSAVERVSRSPYLKSLENIGNDTVKAVLEKNGKRVIRFIEQGNRFCNNTYDLAHPSWGEIKTVFSTPNYYGSGGRTLITSHDYFKRGIKNWFRQT